MIQLKPVCPHLPMLKLSSCSRPRRAGSKLSSWLPGFDHGLIIVAWTATNLPVTIVTVTSLITIVSVTSTFDHNCDCDKFDHNYFNDADDDMCPDFND